MEKEINYQLYRLHEFIAAFEQELLITCFVSAFIFLTLFYVIEKNCFQNTSVILIMGTYVFFIMFSPVIYYILAGVLCIALIVSPILGTIWILKHKTCK